MNVRVAAQVKERDVRSTSGKVGNSHRGRGDKVGSRERVAAGEVDVGRAVVVRVRTVSLPRPAVPRGLPV